MPFNNFEPLIKALRSFYIELYEQRYMTNLLIYLNKFNSSLCKKKNLSLRMKIFKAAIVTS